MTTLFARPLMRGCALLRVLYDNICLAGIDDEDGEQLRGLGVARMRADGVTSTLLLAPVRTGVLHGHRAVIDLAADRALEDRRIDERGVRMPVRGGRAARRVFDEHASHALARHVGQRLIEDDGNLALG